MALSLFLTKRYLISKRDSRFVSTISFITILGIALGVCVVIIALTVLDGFEKIITEKIIDLNSHIKITAFGNKNLPDDSQLVEKLQNSFGGHITKIEPFISKLAIIKSRKYAEGITIIGTSNEELSANVYKFLIKGNLVTGKSDSLPGIIVGKKLAEKLFINENNKVTIFSLNKDQIPSYKNPPSIKQFIVTGIYESGMSEYDDLNAYIDINEARRMFGMESEISGYNIKVRNISEIDLVAEKLQDFLWYPYYVRTIFKVHQNIFTWIELQKEPIPIILGLIIFVAVFNIVGTLLMIVLERTNTIGILRSIGANRKFIIRVFLIHGAYLTVIGVAFGNILALILSILQDKFDIITLPDKIYFVTRVPIYINFENYFLVTGITIFIATISSFLPALIASKIQPISAIRFD